MVYGRRYEGEDEVKGIDEEECQRPDLLRGRRLKVLGHRKAEENKEEAKGQEHHLAFVLTIEDEARRKLFIGEDDCGHRGGCARRSWEGGDTSQVGT